MGMECELYRESLSAEMDGERPAVSSELLRAHVRRCDACGDWEVQARGLAGALVATVAAHDAPDLSRRILRAAAVPVRTGEHLTPWRVTLAAVAVLHVLLALPATLGAPAHTAAELGSWDIALAVGFLFAAWRPARAWGMLPLVAAVVVGVAATGFIAPTTDADLASEAAHLLDVAGLVCVWALAGKPLPRALRPWTA